MEWGVVVVGVKERQRSEDNDCRKEELKSEKK